MEKLMTKSKETKAITLIALIITIIVLLILAMVTIRALQGYGIINHANDAAKEWEIAQVKEQIKLATYEAKMEKLGAEPTLEEIVDQLEEIGVIPTTDGQDKTTVKANEGIIVKDVIVPILDPDDIRPVEEENKEPMYTSTPEGYVPIYTREQLEKIGNDENVYVEQEEKEYLYAINANYILMDNIDLSSSEWTPVARELTGELHGKT